MTEQVLPALRFEINGKIVNLAAVIGQAKPWKDWTIGEKGLLDRLGFEIINRDPARTELGLNDLKALITYYAMKANHMILPADVNGLSEEAFGKIALAFVPVFGPRIFPSEESVEGGGAQTPFANGDSGPSTPSGETADGAPLTSTP